MHKVLPEDTEPLELADAQRGGASAQVAAAAARPEAGSAEWHAALIRRALERDAAKLISRGSQRLGSAQSSRSSGFVTPGRIGLGSREGIRKGYTLANLRASTAAIDDMLSNEGRAQTGMPGETACSFPAACASCPDSDLHAMHQHKRLAGPYKLPRTQSACRRMGAGDGPANLPTTGPAPHPTPARPASSSGRPWSRGSVRARARVHCLHRPRRSS